MKTIEIISIPVTDQERSKAFYQQLGFDVRIEAPFGKGQQWIQLGFPGQDASITLVNWFDEMPAGCIRGFIVKTDDLEKELADLAAKGIESASIDNTPWGRFSSVKDPDGNVISLHQS